MKQLVLGIAACVLISPLLFAQSPPPAFEAADVQASPKRSVPQAMGGGVRNGRFELRNATMVDLISNAYSTPVEKIVGGPSWLELDRFDVIGKVPAGTTRDQARVMLQALLADRFKLVVKQDNKPLLSWVLSTTSAKPKVAETPGSGATGCQGQPQQPAPDVVPQAHVVCHNMSLAAFAEFLPRAAGAYISGLVVDQTGLPGTYDFEMRWTARALLQKAGADGITLDAALEKLGLKVEQKEVAALAFSVESVNRTPTPNAANIAAILPPPPPAEFEVAEIKRSPEEGAGQPNAQILPTGQIRAVNLPLRALISLAFDVGGEEMIIAPKWMDDARFDLIARAFTGPAEQQQLDIDSLRQMMQKLLIDRFKMKTHREDRPLSAFTLTATATPKLTKADPNSRIRCAEGPAAGLRDPRNGQPILARLVTCQNVSMAELAQRLPTLAGGYIRGLPVQDDTKLEGGYNFSFNFTPIGLVQQNPGGRGADQGGAPLAASDPTGALRLEEAFERQLGLKLERRTRPVSVLVIDSSEQVPTDN
jgi:uncharacterized protein (TIGR03435 family)